MMEGGGGSGVGNSYWSVDTLPSPSSQGWTNVAYQTHAYALDGGSAAEGTAHLQVTQVGMHGVPILVGELHLGDRENYGVQLWDDNQLNWTSWTFKARHGMESNWGIYEVTPMAVEPEISRRIPPARFCPTTTRLTTAGQLRAEHSAAKYFGTPLLADDSYSTAPGQPRYVAPAAGVLANDTIPNAGQSGIVPHAYRVDGPRTAR
jgi:hypothetical protein